MAVKNGIANKCARDVKYERKGGRARRARELRKKEGEDEARGTPTSRVVEVETWSLNKDLQG